LEVVEGRIPRDVSLGDGSNTDTFSSPNFNDPRRPWCFASKAEEVLPLQHAASSCKEPATQEAPRMQGLHATSQELRVGHIFVVTMVEKPAALAGSAASIAVKWRMEQIGHGVLCPMPAQGIAARTVHRSASFLATAGKNMLCARPCWFFVEGCDFDLGRF
ncbi:hypothetical protein CLOM_g220, partial [Closterium sp. NIES-68]